MEQDPFIKELSERNAVPEEKVRQVLRDLGIKTNAELLYDMARKDFNLARTTTGKIRENHAMAVWNLKDVVSPEEWGIILGQLFTTSEAIQELIRKGREEERTANGLRAKIKRLFGVQE